MSNTDKDQGKASGQKARLVLDKTGYVLKIIGKWIMRLRKVFMVIPVAGAAVWLALYNQRNLPAMVGINLQADGEYAWTIARDTAVMGPLALTAACLLLMICSRRTLYPWIISIFTLVVPVLILVTNLFPA